jgi:putative acetyltransferase
VNAGYTVRAATPEDAAAIRDVHVGAILGLGGSHYTRAELESWAAGLTPEGYARAMAEGGEAMEVAQDASGRIVAFCARKDDEVMAVYVRPDAARRGLGSLLLQRAEAAIAAAGHRTVRIGASLSGRALYERHGYHVVEEKGWETRGGLVIAACDMEKTL